MEDWKLDLDAVVETMREISRQTEPAAMVQAYTERMRDLVTSGRFLSVTRRGVEPPGYIIARSSTWERQPDPWAERDALPRLEGGLLGELLYSNEPRIIEGLEVAPNDPAAGYFEAQHSLMAIPVFDKGEAFNMVVRMSRERAGFARDRLPQWVWMTNLFGRATHNLVVSQQLREANRALDGEMEVVASIQRSLLPQELPRIGGLDLAVHYAASEHAGGDYYDFLALPDGRWGILLADVSGHGTPAAVLMAITHAITHLYPEPPLQPSAMLAFLNRQLHARYTRRSGTFVTAFFGVYDPKARTLTYASAGHPPPRLRHCDDATLEVLDGRGGPPLGIVAGQAFTEATATLRAHDQIVFYTDGLTEARNPASEFFGEERLDEVLDICSLDARGLIGEVMDAVRGFAAGRPFDDDTTLLVARVS